MPALCTTQGTTKNNLLTSSASALIPVLCTAGLLSVTEPDWILCYGQAHSVSNRNAGNIDLLPRDPRLPRFIRRAARAVCRAVVFVGKLGTVPFREDSKENESRR